MTKRMESKYKIDRRMGENIWGRPKSPVNRREYGPGQHGQRRKGKLSDYGVQLKAKQKLRGYYGNISERQFRGIYQEARRLKGDSGAHMIGLLERRLDAVIYRAKFVPTVFAARQFISHGHIKVNGKRVTIASFRVKVGDVVEVKDKSKELALVLEAQALAERGYDGAARAQAVGAAAQNRGIAGFQAQGPGIGSNVRPALVDNADDAERHPHPFNGHAVRPGPGFGHHPDRVLERAHCVNGFGNRLYPLSVERQPVEEGTGNAGPACLGDIISIGGQNAGFLPADGVGHEFQGAVFLGAGGERQGARGRPGPSADLAHGGGDIACPFDAF